MIKKFIKKIFIVEARQKSFNTFQKIVKMKHIKGSLYLVSQNPKYFPTRIKECLTSIGCGIVYFVGAPITILYNILLLLWLPFQMLPHLYDFCLDDTTIVELKKMMQEDKSKEAME